MPIDASPRKVTPEILWAARMEIIVVVWRIYEALKVWSGPEDPVWVARWKHGIGRELWRAIDAMGVAEAALHVGREVGDVPFGARKNTSLLILLRHAKWEEGGLHFDICTFALATFIANCHLPVELCDRFDRAFGSARWWTWPSEGPSDRSRSPSWWFDPSPTVVRRDSEQPIV
ncbi:hypothetical protein C8Q76DRAFT_697533 [Earliella scabrosa]|nr:hypothetical protein C8Q76DRAFT_697964 [Earliella scabrosa]KAI0703141.1 hypothetical protein C8Q76DRAFT_697533 [Earliella scabrosa]